jgi:hypothetical protein
MLERHLQSELNLPGGKRAGYDTKASACNVGVCRLEICFVEQIEKLSTKFDSS